MAKSQGGLEDALHNQLSITNHDQSPTIFPLPLAYGHDNRIFHARFRPHSASCLATASDDNTVTVWAKFPQNPRYMQVARYGGHSDSVLRLSWAIDGRTIASGSSDCSVRIWQLNGHINDRLSALSTDYNACSSFNAVNPVNKNDIANKSISSRDITARTSLRSAGFAGTTHLATLTGHEEEVYACEWLSPYISSGTASDLSGAEIDSDSLMVSASGDKLYLWNVATQRLISKVDSPIAGDSASRNATPLGRRGGTHDNGNVPERWMEGYLFGVGLQFGGPLIGSACSDGNLRFWAHSNGGREINPLFALPWNTSMGSDCSFLVPTGESQVADRNLDVERSGDSAAPAVIEQDGSYLFAATARDGSVVVVDLRTGGCIFHKFITADDDPNQDPWLPKGRPCELFSCELRKINGRLIILSATSLGKVAWIDVYAGTVEFIRPGGNRPHQEEELLPLLTATLSDDGSTIAAAGECHLVSAADIEGGKATNDNRQQWQQQMQWQQQLQKKVGKWSPVHLWARSSSRN
ncbi:hypothetical protein Ndes2526B_g00290 [Nannochloris sp. 'desiccata']